MSLFGSLMGDFDDDPIFGSHMRSMRQMNSMMNSLFNDPFGMMGQNAIAGMRGRGMQNDMQMMPFGFPFMPPFNFDRMFPNFDNMAADGNCHSFTSRSVMSLANGPDGRPQIYQKTMSTKTAPGGVKETQETVSDSRTGTKKMAIGHHIGDRAHILEREQNMYSGEQEERQEFINLDEEEAQSFNNEWESRTLYAGHGHRSRPDHRQLALPDPTPSSKSTKSKPAVAKPTTSSSAPASSSQKGSRKRDHTPDSKTCKKRHAVSDSDV